MASPGTSGGGFDPMWTVIHIFIRVPILGPIALAGGIGYTAYQWWPTQYATLAKSSIMQKGDKNTIWLIDHNAHAVVKP